MAFSLRFSVGVCSGLHWLVVRRCCEFGLLERCWLVAGTGLVLVILRLCCCCFACCCFVTVKCRFIY